MSNTLYVVVPCYNEQEVFAQTLEKLSAKLDGLIKAGSISADSRLLFVNDGSKDTTWELIKAACADNARVCGMSLSRNRGHQNALLAGLEEAAANCDAAISIDADLQDDIAVFDGMIAAWQNGCDIVYGVRKSRKTDSFVKRATAQGFYKVMDKMGVETIYNHADYRLMSRRALEALAQYKEKNLYLRGIVPMIGYKTDVVYYDRFERTAGVSKYPSKRMFALAANGIYGFTNRPIQLIWKLGCVLTLLALMAAVAGLVLKLTGVLGDWWMCVMSCLFALGGVQLIALGVVGQYIYKAGDEIRDRPRYFVSERIIK